MKFRGPYWPVDYRSKRVGYEGISSYHIGIILCRRDLLL